MFMVVAWPIWFWCKQQSLYCSKMSGRIVGPMDQFAKKTARTPKKRPSNDNGDDDESEDKTEGKSEIIIQNSYMLMYETF